MASFFSNLLDSTALDRYISFVLTPISFEFR
jgi:hypothetical protein